MTVDQVWSLITTWLHRIISTALLLIIAAWLLNRFGVRLPIPAIDHVALTYIAGAYWLTRK